VVAGWWHGRFRPWTGGSDDTWVPQDTTCKAFTKSGKRCRQLIVNADGLCSFHSGATSVDHLRLAGRKGGLRPPGMGGTQGSTLRQFLREKIDPAHVLRAVQAGLDSEDEKEQLTAARMLMAELGEADRTAPVEQPVVVPMPQGRLEDVVWLLVDFLGVDAEEVLRRLVEHRQIGAERLLELAFELGADPVTAHA
jgi:hypothetical protein